MSTTTAARLEDAKNSMQQKHPQQDPPADKPSESSFFGLQMIQFVEILSCVLSEIAEAGDAIPLHPNRQIVSVFHTNKPPQISIPQYLERIVTYAYCSPECFILALIYLDRIVQRNPKFYISSFNIHRLLITSVMVSAKFFDDKYYNNAYYARVGGINTKEMNTMELEFLYLVNFKLHVTPDVFEQYKNELITNDASPRENLQSKDAAKKELPEFSAPVVSVAPKQAPAVQQQRPSSASSQKPAVQAKAINAR